MIIVLFVVCNNVILFCLKAEMSLLGYSLGLTLEVFRLDLLFNGDNFLSQFPPGQNDFMSASVPLILEDNKHYNVLTTVLPDL